MIDKFIFQRAPLLYSVSESIDKMQSGTVCTLGTSDKKPNRTPTCTVWPLCQSYLHVATY